ncbi:hypothetical protein Hanom_Chr01g00045121 [Helianthus anomalus]
MVHMAAMITQEKTFFCFFSRLTPHATARISLIVEQANRSEFFSQTPMSHQMAFAVVHVTKIWSAVSSM